MPMPSATTPRTNPSHAMLHNMHVNVKAFGAAGDGTTDDTTAITNTISAAFTAHQPVFFPATTTSYKITSTIDLTSYRGTVLMGEGSRQGVNGQMGRGSNISAASSVNPMFKWDGDGNAANLSFENLGFGDPTCAVRVSDAANVRFKNCAFNVTNVASADNSNVLLENMFWVWFEECNFNAPTTTAGEAAVILRGKEPSVNADHCYLISFRNCRFWNNGVYYKDQNDITPDPAHAEGITFENCDTENFDVGSALIQFTKTASTNWSAAGRYIKQLSLRNCRFYDFVSTPAVVRYDVPNGINTAFVENILAPRLFERTSGSGGVSRVMISGFEGTPLVDSGGTPITAMGMLHASGSNVDFHGYGQTVGGKIAISSVGSSSHDNITITDTTAGAGITVGTDVNLYRDGANYWATDDALVIAKPFSAQDALLTRVTTEANPRIRIQSDPIIEFGPGGATATDTSISRTAAGALLSNGVVRQTKATPTYSASITPNAAAGDWQTITVTNGTAFTINAPTTAPSSTTSQELVIEIFNNSGGAMGAVTWNAVFKLVGGAFTNPANANKRFIAFKWNGANWVEQSRAGADYT